MVRVVKLNTNALTSIAEVSKCQYLLELQAKTNQIASLEFMCNKETLNYLQKVDLSQNKLTSLPKIECPALKSLVLDENEIAAIELTNHKSLTTISLNKNKLTALNLSYVYELTSLSVAENEIANLEGLQYVDNLKKLNLNTNKLESLETLPEMPCLTELILDANPIAKIEELNYLCRFPKLEHLSMAGSALAEEKGDEFKKEVLVALMNDCPCLTKINGEPFTPEDMQEAKQLKEEREQAAKEKPAEAEGEAAAEGEGDE